MDDDKINKPVAVASKPSGRTRALVLAAAAAAVALVVAAPVWAAGHHDQRASVVAPAAAAQSADTVPSHIVIDDPDWSLVDVRESDFGRVADFRNVDGTKFLIMWRPASQYDEELKVLEFGETAEVLGVKGQTFEDEPPGDYTTLLPPSDGTFVEMSGLVKDRAQYDDVIAHLKGVSDKAWQAASASRQ